MSSIELVRGYDLTLRLGTTTCRTDPSVQRTVANFACPTPGGKPENFWGFSFGSTPASRKRAIYEVYERLFAYRPFRKAYLGRVLPDCFTLLGHQPTNRIPSRYLFVRQKQDHSAGSGSSAHTSLQAALDHGVREVVERDLLCRWWYEGAFRMQAVGFRRRLKAGVYLSSWTVSGGQVPFCVSVVFDDAQTVFVTGSKVSDTLNKARIGAEREAFLLYDTLPRGSKPTGDWRIDSLRSTLAKVRIEHFRSTIDEGRVSAAQRRVESSIDTLPALCGKSLRDASYAVLADLPQLKVTKVHCPGWLTKSLARKKHRRSDVPADPFC